MAHEGGHQDSHDHGHVHLEYQPSLPLSSGKLCMWLFLSTEIMFFAALIGTFIVIRFGSPAWPSPEDVHLQELIGAFNTFVLICSSVTIVLALEFAKKNQAGQAKIGHWPPGEPDRELVNWPGAVPQKSGTDSRDQPSPTPG